MTLYRNPEIWQSLPARHQYELENSAEFTAIQDELEALASKTQFDSAARDRRKALMAEKRKLPSKELHKCRRLQPSKLLAGPNDADLVGYHRTQFHRIRRLIPERDRLASNFFSSLRSVAIKVDLSYVI